MLIGITGHRGVLGSIIKQQLNDNGISFSCFEGDITNMQDVETWLQENPVSHLIHLAAVVSVDRVHSDIAHAIEVNVQGSVNLSICLEKLKRDVYFFYASTCHVYKSSETPLKETDPIDPINIYGMTKYTSEVILESFARRLGSRLCIGRIFSFYHQSQKPPFLYPTILKRLQEEDLKKPFVLRGAKSIRDLSNAESICATIIRLVKEEIVGRINIGTGKGVLIKDFVQSLTETPLSFDIDEKEKTNYLVADITRLNRELNVK